LTKVKKALFLTSAPSIKEAPPPTLSEVAFIGRSNVGKSSLINALLNRKNLAKSSSTPGKTRLINFFDVELQKDEKVFPMRFVDLPGYGYAKASKSLKNEWQKSLSDFLRKREAVRLFLMLRDARHPQMEIDLRALEFIESILRGDQKILIVFTKADKLKQKELASLKKKFDDPFLVSSTTRRGIEELREEIVKEVF